MSTVNDANEQAWNKDTYTQRIDKLQKQLDKMCVPDPVMTDSDTDGTEFIPDFEINEI